MPWEEAEKILRQRNLDHFGEENGKRLREIYNTRQAIRRGTATTEDLGVLYDQLDDEDPNFRERRAKAIKAIFYGTTEAKTKSREGF